jgi:PKD repeat protein
MYSGPSVTFPYGAAPARRVLAGLVFLACLLAFSLGLAAKARAGVGAYAEPRFTKTTTNSWFFNYTPIPGPGPVQEYFVCFTLRKGGIVIEPSNGTNGPGSQNCTGNIYGTGTGANIGPIQPDPGHIPMTVGSFYEMCISDFRWNGAIYQSGGLSACQSTTIDNTKPAIATYVNGSDVYTRNLTIQMHIDYSDSVAVPFPANFGCFATGGGCTVDMASGYIDYCSVPNVPLNSPNNGARINSFDCYTTLNANTPDGIVAFCARAADAAIPDNPASTNQAQPASSANISDPSCGSVILDRTAPSASITASATTARVGDLINFSAQSSDATSGTSGQYTWVFGDNTANGAGANTSHTYTQSGSYEAKVSTTDGAGNTGEGKQIITVNPPATGGGTGGTGGTITPPPTDKSIGNEAGGGGIQETTFAGLGVVAPKKFKIRRGHRKLPLALTSAGPGRMTVALALGRKVVARGAATFSRAGRFGFRLKLPAKMKPGKYKLKIGFKPAGSTKTFTKTLAIRFTGAAPRASRAAAVHSRIRSG